MIRRLTYGLMFLSTILLIIFIVVFIINFSGQSISNDISDWAQFGDYIGGILNPILTLLNICVFVILTLTIQRITDQNNRLSLETSKQIALMSLKHEELNNFKKEMDQNLNFWQDNLGDVERIKRVLYGYNVLEYRMMFLFPELRDSEHNKDLRKYIVEALNKFEAGKIEEAKRFHIPVSNVYGMLVSDLSDWTVN